MSAASIIDWVLHTGLDVSLLILLILLVRRPFGRIFGARAAYSLWCLPLIRIVLPDIPITIKSTALSQFAPNITPEILYAPSTVSLAGDVSGTQLNWQLPLVLVWLGIAFGFLTYQLWRQSRFTRELVNNANPISAELNSENQIIAAKLELKTTPNVLISNKNIGPLVTGLVKPTVILPKDFEASFNRQQQELALLHEFGHIKRKDLWAAATMLIFKAINWPNPLVHFAARKFRSDQEAACDATVLSVTNGGSGTIKTYAETLLHSANLNRNSSREAIGVAPLSLTIYHPLKERLMTIQTTKTKTTLMSRIGVGAFLIAAATATAPFTIATAQEAGQNVEVKSKKVMKIVEENDGVREEKHYEILEEDGVTKAYSIDQHGNRTEIDPLTIDHVGGMHGDMDVMVMGSGPGEQRIKIIGGEGIHEGQHEKVFVKRMKDGQDDEVNVEFFSSGDAFGYGFNDGDHTAAMVRAAQGLLERAGDGDAELSSNAKRKLEKARKALKEAQEALEKE